VSAAELERLAAARAFKPMEAFDELADNHVDFDELLGGERREAALAKALQGTTPARVAVLGPSGSGKSSLIAATLADLPAFLPLSIAIGQADVGILENQARFGQFIIRELSRQAKGRFAAQQKIGRRREAALARLVADTTTRTGPGGKLALNIGIPDYAAVSTEIRSAIKSTESDLNPSQSLEGLEEIARVFSAPERPTPVLIIDDADKWAGSPVPGDEDKRARLLFSSALQPLLTLQLHLVVAVQQHWKKLAEYENLDKRVDATIEIPKLPKDAVPALTQIIASRALDVGVEDVTNLIEDGALARLEAEYDRSDRSIRHVLRVLDLALRDATDEAPTPERLTRVHVRRAAHTLG